MNTENILVIGGTGKTGKHVVNNLQELGHNVRVVGRNSTPVFNWENPETYKDVLENIDRAYIVYYPDLAIPGAKEAITKLTEEALKAGVDKVVLLSGKGEAEAEACEEIVANSGLNYTHVRASWFNQNFTEGAFTEFVKNGVIALPLPDAKIPFVDTRDIADVVSEVLLNDDYNNQTITVTGPEKKTFEELVDIISDKTGRDLHYVPISINEFKEGMRQAGLPEDYIWLFGYLFEEVLGNPANQDVSEDIKFVLKRDAISFEQFASEMANSEVWT